MARDTDALFSGMLDAVDRQDRDAVRVLAREVLHADERNASRWRMVAPEPTMPGAPTWP